MAIRQPRCRLLRAIPGMSTVLGGMQLQTEQVAQIDSKDLEFSHWVALTLRLQHHLSQDDVRAVVVTHGTDTLEETAYWLSQALPADLLNSKPVVLTCAMRPASSQTPDGPGNLLDAVGVAATPGAHGVLVVCAGKIHAGWAVQKVHSYRPDAFDSGDAALVGYVEEHRVRSTAPWPLATAAPCLAPQHLAAMVFPRGEVLLGHACADPGLLSLLLQRAADLRLRGLVLAAPGNGSIHRALLTLLMQAQADGIRVLRSTRCAYGRIVGEPEAGVTGIEASPLAPLKARIRLALDLALQDQQLRQV